MTKWVFANSQISATKAYFACAIRVFSAPAVREESGEHNLLILLDEPGFAKLATLFSQADANRMKGLGTNEQIAHLMEYLLQASEPAEKAGVDPVNIVSAYAYALLHMYERLLLKQHLGTEATARVATDLGAWLRINYFPSSPSGQATESQT